MSENVISSLGHIFENSFEFILMETTLLPALMDLKTWYLLLMCSRVWPSSHGRICKALFHRSTVLTSSCKCIMFHNQSNVLFLPKVLSQCLLNVQEDGDVVSWSSEFEQCFCRGQALCSCVLSFLHSEKNHRQIQSY